MSSPSATVIRKQYKQTNADRSAKNSTFGSKFSKASNITLARDVQRSAFASLTKIKPRLENKGSTSTSVATRKKKPPKIYEPIRLPEDILAIQAHSASTPVTELPYLLIAAHIGALPTTRQFYPTTSATNSPLTVFRDMFVMTIDVRGYKPSSVRLSTDGRLIIIECLQSEVPQVVFTQTGTVDANERCVVDPSPNLNEMPVHTSFNYVQHRVKLPEDFSEDSLKVGLDDVTGHVIITGRLVHNLKTDFPEAWNKNRVVRKPRGQIINTCSNVNLNQEDARKLAAWNAVQGKSQSNVGGSKNDELISTSLINYGRKQWLEKEGAKLRAIQHKALKENILKLTELKHTGHTPSQKLSSLNSSSGVSKNHSNKNLNKHRGGIDSAGVTSRHDQDQDSRASIKSPTDTNTLLDDTNMKLEAEMGKTLSLAVPGKRLELQADEEQGASKSTSIVSLDTRTKDSRPKVSFPPDLKSKSSLGKRRKRHRNDWDVSRSSPRKKSLQKFEPNPHKKKSKDEGKKKTSKSREDMEELRVSDHKDQEDVVSVLPSADANDMTEREAVEVKQASGSGYSSNFGHSPDLEKMPGISGGDHNSSIYQTKEDTSNAKALKSSEKLFNISGPSRTPSGSATPKIIGKQTPLTTKPGSYIDSLLPAEYASGTVSPTEGSQTKIKGSKQSRPSSKTGTDNVSKISSQTDAQLIELEELRDIISRSTDTDKNLDDIEDPIGKQDKAMWEALLGHAGVGKSKSSRPKDLRDVN